MHAEYFLYLLKGTWAAAIPSSSLSGKEFSMCRKSEPLLERINLQALLRKQNLVLPEISFGYTVNIHQHKSELLKREIH